MEELGTPGTRKENKIGKKMVSRLMPIEVPALSTSGSDSQGADTEVIPNRRRSNIPDARNRVLLYYRETRKTALRLTRMYAFQYNKHTGPPGGTFIMGVKRKGQLSRNLDRESYMVPSDLHP